MAGATFFADRTHIPSSFLAVLQKAPQFADVTLHSHNFIEVVFVAKGSAVHSHIDRNGNMRTNCLIQGDIFSVQLNEQHSYECGHGLVLYNIFLRPEFLEKHPGLRELPGWQIFFGERTNIPDTMIHFSAAIRARGIKPLERAVAEFEEREPGYRMVVEAQILDFLVTAMRSSRMKRPEIGEARFSILQSIAMMEENPEQHFTLEQLAKFCKMSIPAYTQKFRSTLGLSPMQYLQKIRLFQVQHYLAATGLSIGEIAELTGFCTANYLIKIFHRELGITPAQYRKARRNLPVK